ncbi:MAG: PAS domain S-box-containing protein [Oleiphilaceae bacterium]|jgi:PAS domain S-box-containing protein
MKLGLRLKQALNIFLVSILISTIITIFAAISQKQTIQYEFVEKGHSLSRLLSATLVSPLYELKIDQIDRLLRHVLNEKDIKRTFVLDHESYILADGTEDNLFSDELINDVIPNIPTGKVALIDIYLKNKQTHLVTSPVLAASGEYLGALIIELSLERTNQAVKKSVYKMAVISVSATLLALVLAFITASLLVKPIIEIKQAAKKIAKGNFSTHINSQRKDELGDLARTINKMALSLNTTTVSKDYIDQIIHTMPDGLIILNQQGNIKQVNPYITKLFCQSSEALEGLAFSDICLPLNNNKDNTREKNLILHGEYEVNLKGQHCLVSITMETLKSASGQVESLVVLHDIRQQKALESERQSALEKAKESVQLKSDFLASMSHEIRTPMNSVLGLLRILLNDSLSEQQRHYVTLALSSADSLLTLLNDILDFSKIDADKLSLEEVDFNMGDLLGNFSESMAHLAQNKGLELILDQSGIDQTHVRGDPSRFKQILTNLIGNAIKFTHSGEIVIRISIQEIDNETLQCSGEISDTGIGIPHEKIDTLFEAFTQADASTTRDYGGTGLGLAIANRLCKKMGNKPIQVSSILGVGSCFKFDLDFSSSTQSKLVEPQVSLKGVMILIVDDNKHSSQAICNQLQYWGAVVTQVEDAKRALELLKPNIPQPHEAKAEFDMVFIDRYMPSIDGCELAKTIRKDLKLDAIPLIIMTNIEPHEGENINFYKNLGFITSFPKPATLSDLSNAAALALNMSSNEVLTHHNAASPPKRDDHNRAKNRILLVDDVMINQLIAVSLLEELACIVDVAEDGIKALEALNATTNHEPYQLIFMDCQMPNMDGYEATRQIRVSAGGAHHKQTPIIAMTANAMKGDKEHCLEVGMSDYISKPIDPKILKDKLLFWLDKIATSDTDTL